MTDKNSSLGVGQDKGAATAAILYLLFTLGFFSWILFDAWIDAHTLERIVGYDLTLLKTPLFHMMAYTIIGGAIGGIVNGIRSFLAHYSAFDSVYFWKYITAPWMGAALALIAFAILQSTVAIFGGEAANVGTVSPQFLANFGVGVLAGYGSKDVFTWLDEKVSKLFAVEKPTPDVVGQPASVAASQIQSQKLSVGAVAGTPAKTGQEEGIVVEQSPKAGTAIESGQTVDMVVATSSNGEHSDAPKADGEGSGNG